MKNQKRMWIPQNSVYIGGGNWRGYLSVIFRYSVVL